MLLQKHSRQNPQSKKPARKKKAQATASAIPLPPCQNKPGDSPDLLSFLLSDLKDYVCAKASLSGTEFKRLLRLGYLPGRNILGERFLIESWAWERFLAILDLPESERQQAFTALLTDYSKTLFENSREENGPTPPAVGIQLSLSDMQEAFEDSQLEQRELIACGRVYPQEAEEASLWGKFARKEGGA